MRVYSASYSPMVKEYNYITLSIHKTKEGALKAIETHKLSIKQEFDNIYNNPEHPVEFFVDIQWDDYQDWMVDEFELLD